MVASSERRRLRHALSHSRLVDVIQLPVDHFAAAAIHAVAGYIRLLAAIPHLFATVTAHLREDSIEREQIKDHDAYIHYQDKHLYEEAPVAIHFQNF